jgi:hypothetical protein
MKPRLVKCRARASVGGNLCAEAEMFSVLVERA